MSNIQTGAERMPHDLSHLGFLAGQIGHAAYADRKSGSAGMPRPNSYAVFCLKKKHGYQVHSLHTCSDAHAATLRSPAPDSPSALLRAPPRRPRRSGARRLSFLVLPRPPRSTLFPYTTLFRSYLRINYV